MAQETNQSQAPLLCPTGCGFYGSPRNNGMCSVCYKDFLQRQNSNGRISPPGLSSTDSSIGESFLAQCPDTTTVPVSTAISHTDVASGHSSGVTTASETSTDESTSGVKASLKADDLPSSCDSVRAAAVGSGQEGQSSPAGSSGTVSASQSTVLWKGTSLEQCSCNGKRKREDTDENIDGDRGVIHCHCGVPPSAPVSEDSVQVSTETAEKPKAKKNRCFTCRKKIGLTGFDCRCGNVFCSMHRYSDTHNCSFDYKAEAAEKIRKENPVIVGEKIQKI